MFHFFKKGSLFPLCCLWRALLRCGVRVDVGSVCEVDPWVFPPEEVGVLEEEVVAEGVDEVDAGGLEPHHLYEGVVAVAARGLRPTPNDSSDLDFVISS